MPLEASLNICMAVSMSVLRRIRNNIHVYCECLEVMVIFNWNLFFTPFRPEGTPFEDGKQQISVFSVILVNIVSIDIISALILCRLEQSEQAKSAGSRSS